MNSTINVYVCRVCLAIAENGFINLNDRLFHLLKVLAPELPIIRTDNNQIICLACNFLLEASWVFKKTCHETLNKLQCYKRRRKEDGNRKIPRTGVTAAHNVQNHQLNNNNNETVQNMQIVFNDASSIASDYKSDKDSCRVSRETEVVDNNSGVSSNLDFADDNSNDTVILSDSEANEPLPLPVSILNSTNLQTVPDRDDQYCDKSHEFIDLEEFHKIIDKRKDRAEPQQVSRKRLNFNQAKAVLTCTHSFKNCFAQTSRHRSEFALKRD